MKLKIYMVMSTAFVVLFLTSCGSGGSGDSGTRSAVDTGPPYVVSTYPVLNSTTAKVNRAITVTFNEDIRPSTISSSTFLVDNDESGDIVSGTITYDSNSHTACFRTEELIPSTSYVATITTDVEDLADNRLGGVYTWQFTTENPSAIDDIPPVVQSMFPIPHATSVAPKVTISVTFNEPIDPSTINTNTVMLNDGTGSVPGTVSYVGNTALFDPDASLSLNANYIVTLAENIKDLAGNPLGTTDDWSFTTGDQFDEQPPVVLSVSPADGAVNMPIDAPLVVTFNEAIKPFPYGVIDGRPVTVSFNNDYTEVTMQPSVVRDPGEPYNSSIRVSDPSGNIMGQTYSWEFTTAQ